MRFYCFSAKTRGIRQIVDGVNFAWGADSQPAGPRGHP